MRPHSGWQVAGRGTLAVLAVLTTFTVGWLVAEIVFRFTGHPPALVGYLIAVVLSLAIGVACASLYARVTGRDDRNLLEEIRIALERISQGDFDIHLDSGQQNPFGEVITSVNKMAHDLGTLEQQRQDFVSNVSHEIQSPLTSISGFTDLLRQPDLDEASRQHHLDIIASECRRLSGLSDNLLRLSSLDDVAPERTGFRLDEHVREAILTLEPQWSAKHIEVEFDADPTTVEADADLLRQVWTNLAQNAVKFTPPGGRVRIRVATDTAGSPQVEVSDTGVGVNPADLPHVFERFYRADKARGAGGNGLGLALAKRIVDLHGGRITIASEPGRGTTFTVGIPAFTSR